MDDLDKSEKLNAKGISPKLRPINPKAISASGIGQFRRDISDEEMQRIINENRVERLD